MVALMEKQILKTVCFEILCRKDRFTKWNGRKI